MDMGTDLDGYSAEAHGAGARPAGPTLLVSGVAAAWLRRLIREPLIHFFIVGAILFFAAQAWRSSHDQHRIVVSEQTVRALVGKHRLQFGRAPAAQELERLVQAYIEEEILYREGHSMGLDKDDEIVRRRVAQKVAFLRQDLTVPAEPTNTQLERYFNEHASRYGQPMRTSFRHLYFSPDGSGSPEARGRAEAALSRLLAGGRPDDIASDPFPDQPAYAAIGPTEAARIFGDTPMAKAITEAAIGQWSGPVRSGYGWHLILAQARYPAAQGDFARLREDVRGDYLRDSQATANARAMAKLNARYTVVRQPAGRP